MQTAMPATLEDTFHKMAQWFMAHSWNGHEGTCDALKKRCEDGTYSKYSEDRGECNCLKRVIDNGYQQVGQMYRLPDYAGQLMSLQAKVITLEYEVARLEHERSRDDQAKHDMQ